MNKMNKNKRIIDCSMGEILDLGKQLIDYYYSKGFYLPYRTNFDYSTPLKPDFTTSPNTISYPKPQFKEGDIICQNQTEL